MGGREPSGSLRRRSLEMPKTVALVVVALALATPRATAAVPKVASIRLVSDGGFAPSASSATAGSSPDTA